MEMPPLRPLVFVVTFLGVFGVLVMALPSGLLESTPSYRQAEVNEYFEAIDLLEYADTWLYCMNETGGQSVSASVYGVDEINEDDGLFGGYDINFFYSKANQSTLACAIEHVWNWFFFPFSHDMNWISSSGLNRGDQLAVSELEYDWDNPSYTVKCSHFQLKAFFAYNETKYNSVEEAWDYWGLWIFLGIEFDDMKTGMNAWDLISMLLFWQLPDVHPILNFLLSLPLWVAFGWIIASIIIAFIRSLPFT